MERKASQSFSLFLTEITPQSPKNLKLQVSEGKKVQVTYDLDMFSIYGGFNSHLQVKGSVKVIKPVTWIRKVKGLSEVSNKLKG